MERLYPVEFGSYMVVAYDEQDEEVKDQTKRVATERLSRWIHEHRLAFAKDDDDFMSELERTKFMRTATGEPVYRTENDHQMAAMECAIMAHEHFFGGPLKAASKIPKLLSAHWLDKPQYGVA